MRLSFLALAAVALAPSTLALPFMNFTSRAEGTHSHVHAAAEAGAEWTYPLHASCNGSQSLQLRKTLGDMVTLAAYARDTLLDNGGAGELEKQYFGKGDVAAAIGYYSRIVRGSDKVLFRCDDPDGNCQLTDYFGHWRGDNATDETVICEKSFQGRRPLEQTCGFGFQLGTDKPSTIWPVDVLHRVMHLPAITGDHIAHVADTYADVLALAASHPELAVANQLTLQLYALDIWSRANVVAEGCVGVVGPAAGLHLEGNEHGAAPTAANTTSTPPPAPASSSPVTAPEAAPAPEAAQQGASQSDCHLHADGSVHCGAH